MSLSLTLGAALLAAQTVVGSYGTVDRLFDQRCTDTPAGPNPLDSDHGHEQATQNAVARCRAKADRISDWRLHGECMGVVYVRWSVEADFQCEPRVLHADYDGDVAAALTKALQGRPAATASCELRYLPIYVDGRLHTYHDGWTCRLTDPDRPDAPALTWTDERDDRDQWLRHDGASDLYEALPVWTDGLDDPDGTAFWRKAATVRCAGGRCAVDGVIRESF